MLAFTTQTWSYSRFSFPTSDGANTYQLPLGILLEYSRNPSSDICVPIRFLCTKYVITSRFC